MRRPERVTARDDYVLFIGNFGAVYNADCLGRIVKSHLKKAGIAVEGVAYLLRHAMVTHMLERTAQIRCIENPHYLELRQCEKTMNSKSVIV